MARKRILDDLVITAIAAVDRPCQEHATVKILKRAPADEVVALVDTVVKELLEPLAKHAETDHALAGAVLDALNTPKALSESRNALIKSFVAGIKRDSIGVSRAALMEYVEAVHAKHPALFKRASDAVTSKRLLSVRKRQLAVRLQLLKLKMMKAAKKPGKLKPTKPSPQSHFRQATNHFEEAKNKFIVGDHEAGMAEMEEASDCCTRGNKL